MLLSTGLSLPEDGWECNSVYLLEGRKCGCAEKGVRGGRKYGWEDGKVVSRVRGLFRK